MTHKSPTSRRVAGVTLLEMMVALAITTFVILVVNQLFNQVVDTVGRGTQAGEILQRSRAFDEQLANETQIDNLSYDPATTPAAARYAQWKGRMVGPAGRNGNGPGGFLVIIQRMVEAPLTLDDAVKGITDRRIRSDQLMFIYDQKPLLDQSGIKRLPPLAPSEDGTFGGDTWNSVNADYVRMWYGHVLQIPEAPTAFNIANHDLGVLNATNPNAVAQDWVLGRHALFLVGIDAPNNLPSGIHAINNITTSANVSSGGQLWSGLTDISDQTLADVMNKPITGFNSLPNALAYQGQALSMVFTQRPLLTSAKPTGTGMTSQDIARTHTYFMGGVSDFIVEFAGDLVDGEFYQITSSGQVQPDGVLDRDPDGRIKWYSYFAPTVNDPVTYAPPDPADYESRVPTNVVNTFFSTSNRPSFKNTTDQAAYVWQNASSNGFTPWPWMLRIRYRLHDRRGEFEGRQIIVNPSTGETEPEPGAWFEMIIPVNHQGVK